MGFDVWIAPNDRGRPFGQGRLGDGCSTALPDALADGADAMQVQDGTTIHMAGNVVVAHPDFQDVAAIKSLLRAARTTEPHVSVQHAGSTAIGPTGHAHSPGP